MRQLVYLSKASAGFSQADLKSILNVARLNNRQAYVTGLLLFDTTDFLQALEGEAAAVAAVFEKICRDPRHHGLSILSDREVTQREFGNWAMAANDEAGAGFGGKVEALISGVSSPAIRNKFENFAAYV